MAEIYDGVKYFGDGMGSSAWQLERAEKAASAFKGKTQASSVNEAIELFNVQEVINAGAYPESWSDARITALKKDVEAYTGIYARFFMGITDGNMAGIYDQACFQYRDDFWKLFDRFGMYKRISGKTPIAVIQANEASLQYILRYRKTVNAYNAELSDYIRNSHEAIGMAILYFFGVGNEALHFPPAIGADEYDGLFLKYTEWNGANPDCLTLLSTAPGLNECPVGDKTRLAAKRAYKKYWQDRKESCVGIDIGVGVRFAYLPECASVELDGADQLVTYDLEWLEENLDYPTILNNFMYVFGQADRFCRSTLPAFRCEMRAFEQVFSCDGKKRYKAGSGFRVKHMLYDGQVGMYYGFLASRGIHLENVFRWFFMEYLPSELGVKGFVFNPPTAESSWLNKYKDLVSEVDAVIKQYKMFLEDGLIDRELFEISSNPVRLSELPSYLADKYAYPVGSELPREAHALFSDQSLLHYTEKTKDKYRTLCQMLASGEDVKLSDFMPNQVSELGWLASRGSICIGDDGSLRLNPDRCFLLKDLYEHEALCPRYYTDGMRKIISGLQDAGELEYAGTLLSRPEWEYFNFVMNKAEYANGMDLRNKYSHGTYTLDAGMQQRDYFQLIKIMVMIIIKMNEEFIIRAEMK